MHFLSHTYAPNVHTPCINYEISMFSLRNQSREKFTGVTGEQLTFIFTVKHQLYNYYRSIVLPET